MNAELEDNILNQCLKFDISGDKLSFSDSSVDLFLLIGVIGHLLNPDFTLLEVKSILSEDGIAIIATPNLAWWQTSFFLHLSINPCL